MKTETFPRNGSTAGLQTYLQDINATPLLSMENEHVLAERIAARDLAARDHLDRANLRLVVNIARGYTGRGLSLEDLIAEGNLGLMRAVEGFDANLDVRFSTYASFWIKQSMRRAVMNQGKLIRVAAYVVSLIAKW
jgi:RNA polymerase primary sigma factor